MGVYWNGWVSVWDGGGSVGLKWRREWEGGNFHKYCSTNYSNAVLWFDVQVSNHNTLLVFFWSDQIETKWPPWRNLQILLTQHFDDVRSIIGKVMSIWSPNFLYGYKVAYAWLVLIFSNFWETRWPPQPIFHKYWSINYSNAVQAIISRFDVQIICCDILWGFIHWFISIASCSHAGGQLCGCGQPILSSLFNCYCSKSRLI